MDMIKQSRKKRSVVWNRFSKDELSSIVKNATSLSQVVRTFGLSPKGSNLNTLKRRLHNEGIDYSHIKLGMNSNQGRKFRSTAIPLKNVMKKNSSYPRFSLKRRLLKAGLLKNECALCGLGPVWNGKPIVMRLDHENGVSNDNRMENLRMVCPNCDSQLPTYCGKNNK